MDWGLHHTSRLAALAVLVQEDQCRFSPFPHFWLLPGPGKVVTTSVLAGISEYIYPDSFVNNCNCNVAGGGGGCARQQMPYGTIGVVGMGSRAR